LLSVGCTTAASYQVDTINDEYDGYTINRMKLNYVEMKGAAAAFGRSTISFG